MNMFDVEYAKDSLEEKTGCLNGSKVAIIYILVGRDIKFLLNREINNGWVLLLYKEVLGKSLKKKKKINSKIQITGKKIAVKHHLMFNPFPNDKFYSFPY